MSGRLTPEQLDEYHVRGFVMVEDVFSRDELDELDLEMDRLLEERKAGRRDFGQAGPGWILQLGIQSEKTAEFCAHERILNYVQDIVKPGIAIYSAKLVSKEPYEKTICHWHQDEAYYSKMVEAKTRMSIWIPFRDTTIEHGCLQVVPGSHKLGLQPSRQKENGTCNLGLDVEVDPSKVEFVPAKAGSMLLFSAYLWHASAGNRTGERRRAFIVSYQEATVPKGNERQWKVLRPAS